MRTFRECCPDGPLQLLGEPLPDHPDLPPMNDPREGPAMALRHWAARTPLGPERWWVVACDLPHWDPPRLQAWMARVIGADPDAQHWVLARVQARLQFLGGVLPQALLPRLAQTEGRSLWALHEALPHLYLEAEGPEWTDVDEAP